MYKGQDDFLCTILSSPVRLSLWLLCVVDLYVVDILNWSRIQIESALPASAPIFYIRPPIPSFLHLLIPLQTNQVSTIKVLK
jgi:hypothetical protein